MELGNITLFACGGAGLNIASWFEKYRDKPPNAGFAAITPIYIDTSKSNITKEHNPEYTYVVDGLDGSGKVRKENAQVITEHVLDILHKFKPGDLSIVISSLSGGSGSVIAPSLVSELLSRGCPVVVCSIASSDSGIEIDNTVNTLKSYESVAKLRSSPVSMIYRENCEAVRRSEVDKQIQGEIVKLAALFSKQNKEMDSSDLNNWLRYPKVTSYQPKLTFLDFYIDKITELKNGTPISVATLAKYDHNTSSGQYVEYQAVGYVDEENAKELELKLPLHYVILGGVVEQIYSELAKTRKELTELKNSRIHKQTILDSSDRATDNGLVL